MRSLKVNLKKRSYEIIVGSGILDKLGPALKKLNIGSDCFAITNPLIKKKYGRPLEQGLRRSGFGLRFKTIADSEKSKSIEAAAEVIRGLAAFDKKRRTLVVAFGGGVVGDLSGFVASVYKRGIPYVQIPTTLLAQVDSSIGGKTAVDLLEGKNLVGAFYQPKLVFSDVKLLSSLNARQMRSGLAEVIKYGIIKDPELFRFLEKNNKALLGNKPVALEHVVRRASSIKASIVSTDEREEKGVRTILNFGHTIGHAVEAASGYKGYNHGEAIALGMLVATDISKGLKLLSDRDAERIDDLIRLYGLPDKIIGIPLGRIINAHYRDKKFIGNKNRFVLIRSIGKAKVFSDVPLELIKTAIKNRLV